MRKHEVRTGSRGGPQRKRWWDREIKEALEKRRAANRAHRHAVKNLTASECLLAWEEYLRCKRAVQQLVQCKIAENDQRQLEEITAAGRSSTRKFWTYVSSLDRKSPLPKLRDEMTGDTVLDIRRHLQSHLERIFDHTPNQGDVQHKASPVGEPPSEQDSYMADCQWEVTPLALKRALARIGAHTASGLDGIPAELVKCLGEVAQAHLAAILTGIIHGDPIPEAWLLGKVSLIPKKGGDSSLLRDHRPLTVTSVLYRLFAQVLKAWMSAWAEQSGHLTELQNGFRRGRRVEDNLFVLSQCIDIARKESRGLVTCFLDVTKAYDNVPHGRMLQHMSELAMQSKWIDLLRRLYTSNKVVACFGEVHTEPVAIHRGLKQGCPLSPLLYMLYVAGLEKALIASGLGFTLPYSEDGLPQMWTLPGLVFADDLVLLAGSVAELQGLVTASAEHLSTLGLAFNTRKSAVLCFSDPEDKARIVLLPGGEEVPPMHSYCYLGITFNTTGDKYATHEALLKERSRRASCILRRRCLWGCNRYLLVRDLWKSVHVPCLTFANAVVCVSAPTRGWLERGQREVGRLALGCHGRVAVEAIQGDLGWSTFEAREATSKIAFEERLRVMNDERWARRLFRYMAFKGVRTQWCNRLYHLRRKFGFTTSPIEVGPPHKITEKVRSRVKEEERAHWQTAMHQKSTLELYRNHRQDIGRMRVYDNSSGSTLLFEARAGALRTLLYCRHYDSTPEVQAAKCRACGDHEESMEHLVLHCHKLRPPARVNATIQQALGFEDGVDNAMDVHTTKERLQLWQRSVRLGAAVVTVQ